MRNDQCYLMPPISFIFSALQPGSPSRMGKISEVNLLLQQTCFTGHQAVFSAAKKAPTWIERTKTHQTLHAPRAHLGSTKTIPSTVNPQSANSAHLASSRRIAQQWIARRARPVINRVKPQRRFAFHASLESTRMRQVKHAAKSAKLVDIKLNWKVPQNANYVLREPSQGIHLKIVHNAFHAVQGNGAMLLARTTTQFVETALLVGTHLPLVCQKNLVASFARKGNLVKKMATLHQLRDARTAIRANTEEMILRQHLARLVVRVFIRTP